MREVDFLGIKVSALTKDDLVEKILEFALIGQSNVITYINAHCTNISFVDLEYRDILNKADIVYADGISIVWGSRMLKQPLPERLTDLDFFDKVIEGAIKKNISFYFLGGRPQVAGLAVDRLKEKSPDLKIIGTHHGYFTKIQEGNILKEINDLRPNILVVGMGTPLQEKWIYNHLNELKVNLCWAIGTFDNLAGLFKRAPHWMLSTGLEWLYRLYQEPKRLWKRYLIGNFVFIYRVFEWKIRSLFR